MSLRVLRPRFPLAPALLAFGATAFAIVACSGGDAPPSVDDAGDDAAPVVDAGSNADSGPADVGSADTGPVGCGVGFSARCAVGEACGSDADCALSNCVGSVCKSASCTDGKRDGDEVGVDCGGVCPQKCDGEACAADGECKSRVCLNLVCAPKGTKTCGVGTATPCIDGVLCEQDKDCASLYCAGNLCTAPDAASHQDGRSNAGETGIDCGGAVRATTPCAAGQACVSGDDCTGLCTNNRCVAPTAADGKKNNGESDVDCGGPNAPTCLVGALCATGGDCLTGVCLAATSKCSAPQAGLKDANETDIDCGGPGIHERGYNYDAPRCPLAKACAANTDCGSGICSQTQKICIFAPSCANGSAGISTCGRGEVGAANAAHESCCSTLPLPATPAVSLDKYELTSGRMRQFIAAVGPDIRGWVAAQIAANTSTGQVLNSQIPANLRDMLPNTANPAAPLNLPIQLGATTMDSNRPSMVQGCYVGKTAYGASTYWQPEAVYQALYGADSRPGGRLYPQAEYDVKSMNCAPYWMYAAFCAWDGGRLPTETEFRDAWGATNYPWGTAAFTFKSRKTDLIAAFPAEPDATLYEKTVNWFNNDPAARWYHFPGYGDPADLSGYISAPGRFPLDITTKRAANGQGWMDLGANMMEISAIQAGGSDRFCDYSVTNGPGDVVNPAACTFTANGQTTYGVLRKANGVQTAYWAGGSWEGHTHFDHNNPGFGFRSYGFGAQTQYGKLGARCARPTPQ